MAMPIPADIQAHLANPMSCDDADDHIADTIRGSMASVLGNNPQLAASQVTSGADVWYIKRVLGPILKRAKPNDERDARDNTPWHLIPKVLNALARLELTRLRVVAEATRALELNETMRKEKKEGGQDSAEILLLPSDKKQELRSLIHPKPCTLMRQNYIHLTLQMRSAHIYEDIRARASGVDGLILDYYPQNLTAPTPHLFIHTMKTASLDELKSYSAQRTLACDLYREVDEWEDELKESISESVMNGLPQDANLKFSYTDEFEKKFESTVSWIRTLTLALGWCKTVQDMVNSLEKVFRS